MFFKNGIFFISSKERLTKVHVFVFSPGAALRFWTLVFCTGFLFSVHILLSLTFKLNRLIRFYHMGRTVSSRLHLRLILYSSISSSGYKKILIFQLCRWLNPCHWILVNGMWVKGNVAFRISL